MLTLIAIVVLLAAVISLSCLAYEKARDAREAGLALEKLGAENRELRGRADGLQIELEQARRELARAGAYVAALGRESNALRQRLDEERASRPDAGAAAAPAERSKRDAVRPPPAWRPEDEADEGGRVEKTQIGFGPLATARGVLTTGRARP